MKSRQHPRYELSSIIADGIVGTLEETDEEGQEREHHERDMMTRKRQHQEEDTSTITSDCHQKHKMQKAKSNKQDEISVSSTDEGMEASHEFASKPLNTNFENVGIKNDQKMNNGNQCKCVGQKDIETIYVEDSDDEESDNDEIIAVEEDKYTSHLNARNSNFQLVMNPVKRVHVNTPGVKELVDESRRNGVPIVIVGHKGWVNFARPWLVKRKRNHLKCGRSSAKEQVDGNEDIDLADPNYEYKLDIQKMSHHLGDERVPYSLPDYDESDPISGQLPAKHIFEQFGTGEENENSVYYLSQWQFPVSETAANKLCYQCKPLPHGIFGEDLLKYYKGEDLPHCYEDNPYQYLFMGNKGSTTKLHVDRGGLDITIAPIVGEKECILVHRDDGNDCFYDLDADLDNLDLDKYPLVMHARVWKTTVKPGEILLMPQETYHKCTNLNSCLSYSRFVLDTVNLIHFYRFQKSGQVNDIDDMDHENVLWNCACELHQKISEYTDDFKNKLQRSKNGSLLPPAPYDIEEKVTALRSLRHILCDLRNDNPDYLDRRAKKPEYILSRGKMKNPYEAMIADVDFTLESFKNRYFLGED